MRRRHLMGGLCAAVAFGVGVAGAATTATAQEAPPVGDPAHAIYDGRVIDLSKGWQGARACIVFTDETRCYDSQAELDAAHGEQLSSGATADTADAASLLGTCSSSLRLYDPTSFGSPSISFTTTGFVLNLSAYGWDNRTSSYAIGACAAEFYSGANLGGSAYPGNTNAFASSATMATGWNNVVSSLYIF